MTHLSNFLNIVLQLMRIAVCVAIVWWAGGEAISGQASHSWLSTKGKIIESSLKKTSTKYGERSDPSIRYEYKVNGRVFTSDRVQFGSQAFSDSSTIISRYPLNAAVDVRYDRANPQTATLETGFNQLIVWPALIGAIIIIAGCFKEMVKGGESKLGSSRRSAPSGQNGVSSAPAAHQSKGVNPSVTLLVLIALAVLTTWAIEAMAPRGQDPKVLSCVLLFGGGLGIVMFFGALPIAIAHFARNKQFKIAGILAEFNAFIFGTFFPSSSEAATAFMLQADISREQLQFTKARVLLGKAIASATDYLAITDKNVRDEATDDQFNFTKQTLQNSMNFTRTQCREMLAISHNDLGEIYLEMGQTEEALNHAESAIKIAQDLTQQEKLGTLTQIQPGVLALSYALSLRGRVETIHGEFEKARVDFERALELRNQVPKSFTEAKAELLANLASAYSMAGENEKAQKKIAEGLALVGSYEAPQFRLASAKLLQHKAESLMRTGQLKDAESNLNQCLEVRKNLLSEHHPRIADTYLAFADLRNLQGKTSEAAAMRNKAQKAMSSCLN